MTEQEAIRRVKKLFKLYVKDEPYSEHYLYADAVKMSEEALEKQMPKELTNIRKVKEYDGYDMGKCPVCGEPLDNSFYENLKYCFVCGQAIKWE